MKDPNDSGATALRPDKDKDRDFTLVIVVNGAPTPIEGQPKQKLHVFAQKALKESNNPGQPIENWQLTRQDGTPLDLNKTPDDYGLESGATLFLNLKAGIGG